MAFFVDSAVILILAFHVIQGIRKGAWPLFARLIGFGVSIAAAFGFYQPAGRYILSKLELLPSLGYGIGFIAVFLISHFLATGALAIGLRRVPEEWRMSPVSRIIAIVPAFIDGFIFVSLLALIVIILPVSERLRVAVDNSKTGSFITENLQLAEQYSQRVFGNVLGEALTFLTTAPDSSESVKIPYKPQNPEADSAAELRMLELVNEERAQEGARPLKVDPVLVEIARNHSRDMWERGYFSHHTPDGKSPFDRMKDGGATFILGGENLAFAPSVGIAHRGLMNSPGHKRNIMDPRFGRIGIGVIDGGIYGKMYTQIFAD